MILEGEILGFLLLLFNLLLLIWLIIFVVWVFEWNKIVGSFVFVIGVGLYGFSTGQLDLIVVFSFFLGACLFFFISYTEFPKIFQDCGLKNSILCLFDIQYAQKNKELIKQNKKDNIGFSHAAILIALRGDFLDGLIYSDGIDLLIEFFLREDIPFNIYECRTPDEALKNISNPQVKCLYIFGHGNMCSLSFGPQGILNYCKLKDAPRTKKIIAQFHCNTYERCECSLADFLLVPDGKKFIKSGYTCSRRNRIDIMNGIQNKWEC